MRMKVCMSNWIKLIEWMNGYIVFWSVHWNWAKFNSVNSIESTVRKHPTYFSIEWFVLTFLKSGCVFSRDVSIKIFGLYFKYVKYLLLFVVVYNLWLLIF